MGADVTGTRFNAHGRKVEDVNIFVNRVGDKVFLQIEGKGPAKMYDIPLTEWQKMVNGTK
jgi:hypothetical protein